MTQEEELLLKDICGRLPYGVKVLCEGWDSDHGCEFNTVEDLIGIDDKFIYTIWRGERDKHSIVEPLSITDYKPYLRPMNSMTEEERNELRQLMNCDAVTDCSLEYAVGGCVDYDDFLVYYDDSSKLTDWLNKNMFDYRGLIPRGLAIETPEETYEHEVKSDVNEIGSRIGVGCKIRSKENPDIILSIISDDCHGDEFECSNGSVLSLKQIKKHYDLYIEENNGTIVIN